MKTGNSRLIDVTDAATAVIVDSACSTVKIKQVSSGNVAFHTGPASSCVTARSAGVEVTFTGDFHAGDIAGYVKLDAAGEQTFQRSETSSVGTQAQTNPNDENIGGNQTISGTLAVTGATTLTGAAALNGGATVPTAKTVTVTDADALLVGGKKVPQTWTQVFCAKQATPVQKGNFFVASRACKIVSIREVHSVGAGGGVTLALRKITDTSAADAAAGATVKEVLKTLLALDSTADTVVSGVLSDTAGDYTFAAGNRLCWSGSAALTGYVGAFVVEFQAV